jgi:hypothetical protein
MVSTNTVSTIKILPNVDLFFHARGSVLQIRSRDHRLQYQNVNKIQSVWAALQKHFHCSIQGAQKLQDQTSLEFKTNKFLNIVYSPIFCQSDCLCFKHKLVNCGLTC